MLNSALWKKRQVSTSENRFDLTSPLFLISLPHILNFTFSTCFFPIIQPTSITFFIDTSCMYIQHFYNINSFCLPVCLLVCLFILKLNFYNKWNKTLGFIVLMALWRRSNMELKSKVIIITLVTVGESAHTEFILYWTYKWTKQSLTAKYNELT